MNPNVCDVLRRAKSRLLMYAKSDEDNPVTKALLEDIDTVLKEDIGTTPETTADSVNAALLNLAAEETSDYTFYDWFHQGINCYLAQEMVYLACEWNEDPELKKKIFSYSPDVIARAVWKYVKDMDDFPRLWISDSTKTEVLQEFLKALEETNDSAKA